jgi:hypothetical protein
MILLPTVYTILMVDFEVKKLSIEEIGKELYIDGGVDAMENIFSQYGTVQYRMNLDSSPSPYRISYYKY